VAGGKYTTYRVMAEDTVDAAVGSFAAGPPGSRTDATPLVGADGFRALQNARARLARDTGLPETTVERLLARYGSLVTDLFGAIADDPALGEPIPGAGSYLMAEAKYAVTHEGALHLDDVLTRRTRISIETTDRGVAAARAIAPLLGRELGWDGAAMARELAHYDARVEAERESQRMPDDHTADAARLGAPDVRVGMRRSTDD
jgi:glycerol-3-phosphate dehydrogenase